MNDKISKITLYILFGLSILVAIIFFFGPQVPVSPGSEITAPSFVGQSITWSYILIGIGAVLALIFPIISILRNPKKLKRTLIGLVVAAAFIGICYLLASDAPVPAKDEATPQTLKMVGTGLVMCGLLIIVAIVGILVSTIANIFK
jgi:hypothetical protein